MEVFAMSYYVVEMEARGGDSEAVFPVYLVYLVHLGYFVL
jgi:hypothetical protein